MTEKIQYYASDLAYALDIGESVDMHVVTLDGGRQVLRIEHLPKAEQEYKTVRKQAASSTKKPAKRARSVPDKTEPMTKPADLMGKLAGVGKAFLTKPMKRPDEW